MLPVGNPAVGKDLVKNEGGQSRMKEKNEGGQSRMKEKNEGGQSQVHHGRLSKY